MPLDGVIEVTVLDRSMTRRAWTPEVANTEGFRASVRRRDLLISWPDRRAAIAAPHRPRALERFAAAVSEQTAGRPPAQSGGAGPAIDPRVGLGGTEWLSMDAGVATPGGMLALVALVTVGITVLFAAAGALASEPQYGSYVASAAEISDDIDAGLLALGASTAPSGAEVAVTTDGCERDQAWLWGGPHGVAEIRAVATVPADATSLDRAWDRFEAAGGVAWTERERGFLPDDLGGYDQGRAARQHRLGRTRNVVHARRRSPDRGTASRDRGLTARHLAGRPRQLTSATATRRVRRRRDETSLVLAVRMAMRWVAAATRTMVAPGARAHWRAAARPAAVLVAPTRLVVTKVPSRKLAPLGCGVGVRRDGQKWPHPGP